MVLLSPTYNTVPNSLLDSDLLSLERDYPFI